MALTRSFKVTLYSRLRRDAAFRRALLREAIEVMLGGELETGKAVLRDYVNGTIGFRALSAATRIPVKSLMRMLGPNGNPQAANLFEIVAHLQKKEGIRLEARPVARRRRRPSHSRVVKRRRARA
jgi:hypothetical protein